MNIQNLKYWAYWDEQGEKVGCFYKTIIDKNFEVMHSFDVDLHNEEQAIDRVTRTEKQEIFHRWDESAKPIIEKINGLRKRG